MSGLFLWVMSTGALLIAVGAYLIYRITQEELEELEELGIRLNQKDKNV
jgi:type VI protein secretion system component VasF